MFKNEQGVTKIVMHGTTHLYCPLGDDWYTASATIEVTGPDAIPDYIDVTKEFEAMDGERLIIEDAAQRLARFIRWQVGSGAVLVRIDVTDARHIPVSVEVTA